MDDAKLLANLPALAWLLMCSGLVFIMQAGFAMVEAGSVRFKNSINVALKNVIDLCCSFAAFFVIGYSLMFGPSVGAMGAELIGTPALFLDGLTAYQPAGSDVYSLFPYASFLFQATFCSTAATIVSGAVAERCRFMAYVLVSIGIAVVIYPIFGHWTWGMGWLADLGYHDFAGSSVVHLLGAGVALAGVQVLGARAGRFATDGAPRRIPASSMPMVAVGVVVLAFGWIGFNGGSAALGKDTATIIIATLLAGCFGGLAVMLLSWAVRGVPQADLILNGLLGGLVAITAGANCVSLPAAAVIGLLGGTAVVVGTWLMDRCRLDDAVGAVAVHGAAGVVGVLCVGVFVDPAWLKANRPDTSQLGFLGVQALGALVCIAWAYLAGLVLWWLVGRLTGLRIGPDEEAVGMNYSEHKVDDPVQELVLSVQSAIDGRPRGFSLDDVREGDLLPLARAVRALVERRTQEREAAVGWAAAAAAVRSDIRDQHGQGMRLGRRTADELAAAQAELTHVHDFLAGGGDGHPAARILADLVAHLRRRLDALAEEVPRTLAHLDRMRAVADRLDGIGTGR